MMTTTAQPAYEELLIPARELRVGDVIVLARNNRGKPTRTATVATLTYGEGCKGYHVNAKYAKAPKGHPTPGLFSAMLLSCDGCWDSCALVDVVRFTEDAPHDR